MSRQHAVRVEGPVEDGGGYRVGEEVQFREALVMSASEFPYQCGFSDLACAGDHQGFGVPAMFSGRGIAGSPSLKLLPCVAVQHVVTSLVTFFCVWCVSIVTFFRRRRMSVVTFFAYMEGGFVTFFRGEADGCPSAVAWIRARPARNRRSDARVRRRFRRPRCRRRRRTMGSRRPADGFFTYGRGVLPKFGRRCGTTVSGVVFTIRFAKGEGTV